MVTFLPQFFRQHPICGMPVAAANNLAGEYGALPARTRRSLLRKAWQRELWLRLSGQARWRAERVPAGAARMLWIYPWTTVGDSIMDLAVRAQLAARVEIDLLIAPSLAVLYRGDPHFRRVASTAGELADLADRYDFVLLHDMSTTSLRLKARAFRRTPFATMYGHLHGEQLDRQGFAQRRAEALFGLPQTEPSLPGLAAATPAALPTPAPLSQRSRVVVALGGRDARRSYPHWPQVLQHITGRWPASCAPLEFVLVGNGKAASDVLRFDPAWLARHACNEVGRHDLAGAAALIRQADAFLGCDGGLMHLAAAFDRPGLGVFVEIDPRWRLHPRARLRALFSAAPIEAIAPAQIAEAWMAAAGVVRAA